MYLNSLTSNDNKYSTMRAHDFFNEDQFGTEPKRPARSGSRPGRGHSSEPRYKSAPVVPGGDNPDAVHVPNKGDEPVQRGDQVVVQDPDNIATVFTGTVKRVGREHVYVTLKNGETIAAPHYEVSKSYEVLSKRAHNILNKKGPSKSKYKVDEDWGKVLTTGATVASLAAGGALGWYNGTKFNDEVNQLEKVHAALVVKDPTKAAELQKAIDRINFTKGNAKLNATTRRNIEAAKKLVNESLAETKKLTSREKFVKGLKRGGYDVEERSKFWDAKVKELEQQRDEYEKELASRKQGVAEECAGVGIVTKQNSTADVGPGTIKKNLKAFSLEEMLAELGVDKTFKFAKKAHGDQMYGDQPYWTHPRAVAAAGKRFFGAKFNNDAIKVAFLHDVVEDTPYKLEQLKNMGLSPEVIEAVGLLTKNKALSYEENIKNIIASGNRLAMMVKYADNFKNYTGDKSTWDPKRAAKSQQKYQGSLNMLGNKLGIDKHSQHVDKDAHVADMEQELEEWKASRKLCRSSTPDSDLGASALSSCKAQGLRARDGNKSHKLGKSAKSRVKVGGHRIKGHKYGGPLPDWS